MTKPETTDSKPETHGERVHREAAEHQAACDARRATFSYNIDAPEHHAKGDPR